MCSAVRRRSIISCVSVDSDFYVYSFARTTHSHIRTRIACSCTCVSCSTVNKFVLCARVSTQCRHIYTQNSSTDGCKCVREFPKNHTIETTIADRASRCLFTFLTEIFMRTDGYLKSGCDACVSIPIFFREGKTRVA